MCNEYKSDFFFSQDAEKIAARSAPAASVQCFEHVSSPAEPWITDIHRLELKALHILYCFKPQRHSHFEGEERCLNEASAHRPLNGDIVSCEFDHLSFHGKHSLTTASQRASLFSIYLVYRFAMISTPSLAAYLPRYGLYFLPLRHNHR